MGNTALDSAYQFQSEFSIQRSDQNFFELEKQSKKYIGKKLQSTDQQQVAQIQAIIAKKLSNNQPYVTKLLDSKHIIKEDAPCFKPWNYFYLLYDKKSNTLQAEIRKRIQNKTGFMQKQIDEIITKISKAIKYIYSIGHEHCRITTNAILFPNQQNPQVQLVDRWALEDDFQQYKQEYSVLNQDQHYDNVNAKQALDLYRLGVSILEMIYLGRHRNPNKRQVTELIKGINNQNIKKKLQIICNSNPEERLKIYTYENIVPQQKFTNSQAPNKNGHIPISNQHNNYNKLSQTVFFNTQFPTAHKKEITPIKTFDYKNPSPLKPNINPRIKINYNEKLDYNNYTHTHLQNTRNSVNTSYRNTFQLPISLQKQIKQANISSKQSVNTFSFGNTQNKSNNRDEPILFTSPDFFRKVNNSSGYLPNQLNHTQSVPQVQNSNGSYVSKVYNSQQSFKKERKTNQQDPTSSIQKSKGLQDKINIQNQDNGDSTSLHFGNQEQNNQEVTKSIDFHSQYVHNNEKIGLSQTPSKNKIKITTIPQLSESANSNNDIIQEECQYVHQQYENGSKYQGYKSKITGAKTGRGKFYYKEGSYYDGEWKDNNMHGYGKLFYSNKKPAYEGQWYFDRFHGRGKVYNDEPIPFDFPFDYKNFDNLEEQWQFYDGILVSDEKQGEGKLMLSNGEYYEGQFQKDRVHGTGKFHTLSGQIIRGVWNDSVLVKRL